MALHTDELYPHVHVILKARDENGDRMNIPKVWQSIWTIACSTHVLKRSRSSALRPASWGCVGAEIVADTQCA
jgi:hypothetical protein